MSHPPSTPVKVPTSATTYTPATQDVDLRSQINTLLLREGHTTKIQERFLHSLDAHSSNWPSAIQSHAVALLRSGEVSTFPALIRRVLEDVRRDTASALSSSSNTNSSSTTTATIENNTQSSTNATESNSTNKDGGVNGTTNGTSKTASSSVNGSVEGVGTTNLAIPTAVVEAVLKVVRDSLEAVCEVDPDGPTGG